MDVTRLEVEDVREISTAKTSRMSNDYGELPERFAFAYTYCGKEKVHTDDQ